MKKVLSLVLVLTLVLGSFSFAFAAVEFDDVEGKDCEDAVKTLAALGVVNGRSERYFEPEGKITRAELAKMLIYVLGYDELVTKGTRSGFSDTVGHWAEPEIALAAGQEIIKGKPDGTFAPEDCVTYDEAITMIVRALGYKDESLRGTWPANFKIKAKDLEITDDVDISLGNADRGGVAMLVNNALSCEVVTVNSDGDIERDEIGKDGDDPIYRKLIDKVGDQEDIEVTPDTIDEDDKAYEETLVDLESYMYETIVAYKNNDDEVVYVAGTRTKNIEGTFKGIADGKVKVKVGEKTKKIDLENVTPASIYYNGADSDLDIEDIAEDAHIKLVFSSYKGNPDIDTVCKGIVVEQTGDIVFVEETFDPDYPEDFNGIALPLTEDDDDDIIADLSRITVKGAAESLEDIEKNDIINVYTSNTDNSIDDEPDYLQLFVTRESIEGKVSNVKKDAGEVTEAKIDGEYYDIGTYALNNDGGIVVLGAEGTFFLDKDGDIVAWTGDSILLNDYAFVIALDDGEPGDFDSEDAPRIKMVNEKGKDVIYDFKVSKDRDGNYRNVGEATLREVDDKIVVGNIEVETLVKYKINNDNEITDIRTVTGDELAIDKGVNVKFDDEMLNNNYDFVSSTIIINYDLSDYSVVKYEDLTDDTIVPTETRYCLAAVDPDSLGKLAFVYVVNGVSSSQDNFAAIVDVDYDLDENDNEVPAYTVFLDGKKLKLPATDNSVIAEITTDALVNLDINSDDEISDISYETPSDEDKYVEGIVTRRYDDRISIRGKSGSFRLDKECGIYEYDEEDDELKLKTSIRSISVGDFVKLYNPDNDDKKYDAVLIINYEE